MVWHSGGVCMTIEKVSLGPYLKLYGRAKIPGLDWTVCENQVEPRLSWPFGASRCSPRLTSHESDTIAKHIAELKNDTH